MSGHKGFVNLIPAARNLIVSFLQSTEMVNVACSVLLCYWNLLVSFHIILLHYMKTHWHFVHAKLTHLIGINQLSCDIYVKSKEKTGQT